MPFAIAPLRRYNVIISRKQLKYFRVNLDIAGYRLIWPTYLPAQYFADHQITVTRESLLPPKRDLVV